MNMKSQVRKMGRKYKARIDRLEGVLRQLKQDLFNMGVAEKQRNLIEKVLKEPFVAPVITRPTDGGTTNGG